jgi:ribosomal protein L4
VISSMGIPGRPSTRSLASFMEANKWTQVLFVGTDKDEMFKLSCRNLEHAHFLPQIGCNVYDVMRNKHIVFSIDGLRELEARLVTAGMRRLQRERLAAKPKKEEEEEKSKP